MHWAEPDVPWFDVPIHRGRWYRYERRYAIGTCSGGRIRSLRPARGRGRRPDGVLRRYGFAVLRGLWEPERLDALDAACIAAHERLLAGELSEEHGTVRLGEEGRGGAQPVRELTSRTSRGLERFARGYRAGAPPGHAPIQVALR